jgi:hypothetical protein
MPKMKKIHLNEKMIIRYAMLTSKENLKSLAEKLGVTPGSVSNKLNRADSTVELASVYSMLDVMGFEIVVRDKFNRTGNEFIITELKGGE